MMNKTPGIRIALWTVNSENDKAPKFNGYVNIDGVDYPVSVWDNTTAEHPKAPVLKGKNSKPSPKLELQPLGEPEHIKDIVFTLPF